MPRSSALTDPPRVLYCTDTYPPQVNGVSVVTALSLQGLVERGWKCAVVAPCYPERARPGVGYLVESAPPVETLLSLPSLPLPAYPDVRLALPAYFRVRSLARRFRPQIIHCVTEFALGRVGQLAAASLGIPVVTSYHTDFGRYTASYGAPMLRNVVSRYLARFHRRGSRTFTPSRPCADDLRALGVRDVEVWGRGVDAEVFNPRRRSMALRASWEHRDAFTFVHVGRLAAEKDVQVILEAFGQVSAMMPPGAVQLLIAGTGPAEGALRAAAPPGVSFLGILDRRRALPELYASGDAFVFASTTETLGLVVLEAMAAGLPVIAAPEGGVADHLRDGVNGLAFPARDVAAMAHRMLRLVHDHSLRDRMAAAARETAEALSWSRELDRLDASYREVIVQAVGAGDPRPLIPPPAPVRSPRRA